MKKILVCISTFLVIVIINYLCTLFTDLTFIDVSFFIGVLSAVIIKFFASSGGLTSEMARMQIQGQTGIKIDREEVKYNPSFSFYTAIAYTILSAFVTFIYYKDYFI